MALASTTAAAGEDAAAPSGLSLSEVLHVARARRGLILTVALAAMALTLLVLSLLPTLYSASALVMLEQRRNNVADVSSVLSSLPTDPASVQNQIQILTSRDLASRVVDKLGLESDPEFVSGDVSETLSRLNPLAPPDDTPLDESAYGQALHERAVNAFQRHLTVEGEGLSTAIAVTFSSRSPEKAARIANAIAETYVEMQLDTKFQATREATEWLEGRVRQLARQVQIYDGAVERYKAENNLNETADGTPLIDQQITAVSGQIVQARADLAQKQATFARVNTLMQAGHGGDISQAVASPLIIQLRSQEADLIRGEAELTTRYGPKHPKLIAAESQKHDLEEKISQEVGRLAGSLSNDVSIARAQVESLQNSLAQAEDQARAQNIVRIKLKSLQVNAASTRSMYEAFVSRLKAIQDQDAIQASDARVISHASVPGAPSSPHRMLIFAASIPASLLLGLLVALMAERFAPGLRSLMPRDPFRGVPVIAEIPGAAHARAADLVTDWPLSAFAQSVTGLAQRIAYGATRGGPRVIAVTSPQAGEGATGIALGLARAASRLGCRVIVLDGNLAAPSLVPMAGLRAVPAGLTQVLAGRAPLSRALVKDPRSNAMLLSPAERRSDVYQVLGSAQMARLVGHLRGVCDLVIVNAPPVLARGGTHLLAGYADAVMLVARTDVGPRPAVAEAIAALAKIPAPPIGIVLAS